MKNFSRILFSTGLVATMASTASAEVSWNLLRDNNFIGSQSSAAVMADFNNDNRLDLLYTGTSWVSDWEGKPGVFSWQDRTSLYFNNGKGDSWDPHVFTPVADYTYEEEVKDADGNPVLDDEGNPVTETKQHYSLVNPHGIVGMEQARIAPFDYNNDGFVDIFVVGAMGGNDWIGYKGVVNALPIPGDNSRAGFVALFKNNGNGTFTMIEECGIPYIYMQDDEDKGDAMFHKTIAVADYDHDGYTDILLCGKHLEEQPEGYPKQFTGLFHNDGGTGKFTNMHIAKVQGDVWTKEVTEEAEEGQEPVVVVEKKKLDGWFLPTEHNCHFVDLNNDGWVDIVTDGYVPVVADGVNESGTLARIYLNREGKEFEDVTPLIAPLDKNNVPRSACSAFADFDKDGYLDFFTTGWTDGQGAQTRLYTNQLGWDEQVFGEFLDQQIILNKDGQEGEWLERTNTQLRDFDGDGILDICFEGKGDYYFYYGTSDGNFMRGGYDFPTRGINGKDGHGAFGDLTGNGLADYFQVGYAWRKEEVREEGTGDWEYGRYLYRNDTDVKVVAPVAPAEVTASLEDGKLTVNWKDVEEEGDNTVAYNVFVKYPSGKIFANIPADPESGFVRVSEGKASLIRPFVNSYVMDAKEDGKYTVGVQAVSIYNETFSPFTTVSFDGTGVESVSAASAMKVAVEGSSIIVKGAEGEVKVYDIAGRQVAAGVAGQPVEVAADGVLVVSCQGKVAKIVK